MRAICAGQGEIGKAVKEVFGEYHDIFPYDTKGGYDLPKGHYDILLVCFPWQENFVEIVNAYRNLHHIKATIIFSTVPIGTTRQIPDAVHAPIEGVHPKLAESVDKWNFTVGGINEIAEMFFLYAKKSTTVAKYPEATEIAKLASTTLYGVNIEFARYINEICKKNNVPYDVINGYNECYNALYEDLGMPQYSRYILKPPEGKKGGHCINNNSKILQSQYPSVFNEIVLSDEVTNNE